MIRLDSARRAIAIAAAALFTAPAVRAQAPMVDGTQFDTSAFSGLKWREIGPFRGGRSVAVAGSAARVAEFWMGTTGGGVYKSTDGGNTWMPSGEKYFGGTIGAIGVSESNPDIVYVGTGEWGIRGNVSAGDGVWKTTDAGKTWTHVGLEKAGQISRVRVHPSNPDIVYAAVLGDAWGPSAERGVFKSTDGGKNWRKVLFRNDSTGSIDMILDPSDASVIYASLWQAGRKPWQLVSGGAGSGIFKSTDAGEHWLEITRNPGLPSGLLGTIGLAVSPANPKRVWALVENKDAGGVYRSEDAGATWHYLTGDHKLRERAWYYSKIYADPKDQNVVYAPNVGLYKSTDGGTIWHWLQDPHGDNHDLWIAPNDGQRMIESNDGGANVSYNGGKTWSLQDYATAQFYHVSTTNHFPYRVCGAQQDNSALCGPSRFAGGIPLQEWYDPGGGESGYIEAKPDEPDVTFGGDNSGLMTRKDHRTDFLRVVSVWPDSPDGHAVSESRYRFQWTAPILISPHDPGLIYTGGNVVFKSTDQGQSWTAISPDLTRNDPKTTGISGGPITHDQSTAEFYATVFTIAESFKKEGVLWAGSDDGLIHVTLDGGKKWTNVTPPNFGDFTRVSLIEAGHYAEGTAYVAANRYQLQDDSPLIYKTEDFGKTWTKIVNGLPAAEFVRAVREDPVRRGLLFACTEKSVYVSFDDGAHWRSLKRNLPWVPVHDLAIKGADLIAATHGRSFWILDDITPLRMMTPDAAAASPHVYAPIDAWRVHWGQVDDHQPPSQPLGMNPSSGAIIYYALGAANQKVTVEILDAKGTRVRSFSSDMDSLARADSVLKESVKAAKADSIRKSGAVPDTAAISASLAGYETEWNPPWPQRVPPEPRAPNKTGLNRFAWSMDYPDAKAFTGMLGVYTGGPMALAGVYWVRVTAGGKTDSARFMLKNDPRINLRPVDLQEQFAFQMKVRDTVSAGVTAVLTVRNVRWQLADRMAKLDAANAAKVDAVAKPFSARITAVEESLYEVNMRSDEDGLVYAPKLLERTSSLAQMASTMPARPTNQMGEVYDDFAAQIAKQLKELESALATDLPRVNAALKAAGAAPIVPSAVDVLKPVPNF
jgi:photosystem II stability/assembly factor-like uncharacterized protein